MSRSYRKPYVVVTKRCDPQDRRAYRHGVKQAVHEMEIDFDPDRDWEEFHDDLKAGNEWGTKFGFDTVPSDADSTRIHERYWRACRK